jgi:hypothetical protein
MITKPLFGFEKLDVWQILIAKDLEYINETQLRTIKISNGRNFK